MGSPKSLEFVTPIADVRARTRKTAESRRRGAQTRAAPTAVLLLPPSKPSATTTDWWVRLGQKGGKKGGFDINDAPRSLPIWCQSGPWLAQWPDLIATRHARVAWCKNVSVFTGN